MLLLSIAIDSVFFSAIIKLNWNMNPQSSSCFEWRCRQHELLGAINKRNSGVDAEFYVQFNNQSGFIEAFRPIFGIDSASNVSESKLYHLFQSFCSDEFVKQQFNWSSMSWSILYEAIDSRSASLLECFGSKQLIFCVIELTQKRQFESKFSKIWFFKQLW